MSLLKDLHHLAFITSDLDRLSQFYERVFEAPVIYDVVEDGLRHPFIEVGPHTVLHPFQIPGVDPPAEQPMFARGRLDHFALNADSEGAFRELRRRIVAAGAGDGVVTDMGSVLSCSFTDPDGGAHEVVWVKPGVPVTTSRSRQDWTTVQME